MSIKSLAMVISAALFALLVGCSSSGSPSQSADGSADSAQQGSAVAIAPAVGSNAEAESSSKSLQGPVEIRGHFSVVSDEHSSRISWTAIKNGAAKVVGEFTRIAGGLFLDPTDLSKMDGTFDVHLGDIDSKIPLRDANIAQFLFGAAPDKLSTAIVEIRKVTPVKTTLAVGESTTASVEFTLGLISGAVQGTAEVTLTRAEEGRWKVTSTKPIMLSLDKLNLTQAAEALRARCAHQSIGDGVELQLALELMTRPIE